jgi:hypothetical protein
MITKQALLDAPPYALIRGDAEDTGLRDWALFEFAGDPDGLSAKLVALGLEDGGEEPQRDAAATVGTTYDDLDAALRYLSKGGTLLKVPDDEGSPFFRLLTVWPTGAEPEDRPIYEVSCHYCGDAADHDAQGRCPARGNH